MGPSGSGKTTLLNVISTLDKATEGIITIAGTDITKMRTNDLSDFRFQKLGFIFQDFNLLANLSIYENIALPLSLQGKSSRDIKTKVQGVTDMLGITSILSKYPAEISGGQKQRTAAARALLNNPTVLVLDEATSALDHISEARVDEYLSSINCTRIVIYHRLSTVMNSDMIIVLENGKVCDVGNHSQLLHTSSYYQYYYREMSS
ncbi:ABC transporter family protein (plasmid) [Bacillus pseudomycoides]|nr:ABC transporter family protein [Bacillus pseudomycoides]AJI14570.1 ABC transporter family protein [Bacillus pseudomycoides]